MLARVEHGEFTTAAANGATQTFDIQRGTITAVDANSVTLRSSDGYTATYSITPNTALPHMKGRRAPAGAPAQPPPSGQPAPGAPANPQPPTGANGLRPNETVRVIATKSATTDTATRITPIRNMA